VWAPDLSAQKRDTVLVVDDTPETLSLLTHTLDHAGYTVLIATDGAAALELLGHVTPDIVLMDALMPGISGFETCRRLKREHLLAHVPVIFMTGLSETEHVVEGLASGGVDYVTKPIVLEVLLARIRVHLANARAALETHAALDASGRFLIATNRAGRVLWCTPRARELLDSDGTVRSQEMVLPGALLERMLGLRRANARVGARAALEVSGRKLECTFVSSLGPDELLFRLSEARSDDVSYSCTLLQRMHNLTAREAEVLLWLSRGKANRAIGEILGISPRTVNKHLEQVFIKLGVENRAAAAAAAVRSLA